MTRALVTGGSGFIGSHLVERLINDGHEVIVLDNLSSGRAQNLAHLSGFPNYHFYNVDIRQHETIERIFASVDWVFHVAGVGDVVPSIEDPLEYHRSNVD